jgi:hypothetical protein
MAPTCHETGHLRQTLVRCPPARTASGMASPTPPGHTHATGVSFSVATVAPTVISRIRSRSSGVHRRHHPDTHGVIGALRRDADPGCPSHFGPDGGPRHGTGSRCRGRTAGPRPCAWVPVSRADNGLIRASPRGIATNPGLGDVIIAVQGFFTFDRCPGCGQRSIGWETNGHEPRQ